jgi:hypothetical protein
MYGGNAGPGLNPSQNSSREITINIFAGKYGPE